MAYQVLSPDLLKKYKPNQYKKVGGVIILLPGVKPIPGTTKEIAEPSATTAPKSTTPNPDDIKTILKGLGLSDDIINALPEGSQGFFASLGEAVTAQYNQGKTVNPEFTDADIERVMGEAANNPAINAWYQEQARVGTADFKTAVESLKGDYEANKIFTERQQATEAKNLTEQQAAAGKAYSGFRKQAEEKLKADQSSVIQSSQRQLKQNIQSLGSGYEKTFGTTALTSAGIPTIDGQTVTPTGGVAGTQEQSKAADVASRRQDVMGQFVSAGEVYAGPGVKKDDPATTPATTTPSTSPTATPPSTAKTGRNANAPEGYHYVGTVKGRDDAVKAGKKVKKVGTMTFVQD